MAGKPAFLLVEVMVALMIFISGVAVCMHFMAQLTKEQKAVVTLLVQNASLPQEKAPHA